MNQKNNNEHKEHLTFLIELPMMPQGNNLHWCSTVLYGLLHALDFCLMRQTTLLSVLDKANLIVCSTNHPACLTGVRGSDALSYKILNDTNWGVFLSRTEFFAIVVRELESRLKVEIAPNFDHFHKFPLFCLFLHTYIMDLWKTQYCIFDLGDVDANRRSKEMHQITT